jgi:hypothetical protein
MAGMTTRNAQARMARMALAAAHAIVLAASIASVALFVVAVPMRLGAVTHSCAADCAAGHLSPSRYAALLVGSEGFFAVLYIVVAQVIFWRRGRDPMALFVSFMLVLWGTTFPPTLLALPAADARWQWPVAMTRFAGAAALTLFFYIFPDGRFRPRWATMLAIIWIATQVPRYFMPTSIASPDTWPPLVFATISAGFLGVMIAVQVYRYRRVSDARQQRQTKWVVLGIAFALAGYALLLLLTALDPALGRPGTLGQVALTAGEQASVALIPLALAIAILRDRLYDVDVLINRALVYGTLTALVALLYVACVVMLQQAVQALTGQMQRQDPVILVITTLAVAALAQPLRRRIQRGIDRRFFRRRYDAAQTLAAFGAAARDEVDLSHLTQHLLRAVEQTMEPTTITLWLPPYRPRQTEAPQVAHGSPAAEAQS